MVWRRADRFHSQKPSPMNKNKATLAEPISHQLIGVLWAAEPCVILVFGGIGAGGSVDVGARINGANLSVMSR